MTFGSKWNDFQWRKYISKLCLQNGGLFICFNILLDLHALESALARSTRSGLTEMLENTEPQQDAKIIHNSRIVTTACIRYPGYNRPQRSSDQTAMVSSYRMWYYHQYMSSLWSLSMAVRTVLAVVYSCWLWPICWAVCATVWSRVLLVWLSIF